MKSLIKYIIIKFLSLVMIFNSFNINILFAAVENDDLFPSCANCSISAETEFTKANVFSQSNTKITDFASATSAGWMVEKTSVNELDTVSEVLIPQKLLDIRAKQQKIKSSFASKLKNRSSRQHLNHPKGVIKKRTVGLSAQDAPVYDSRIVASPEYMVLDSVEGDSTTLIREFDISNGGADTLNYTISENTGWFSLSTTLQGQVSSLKLRG